MAFPVDDGEYATDNQRGAADRKHADARVAHGKEMIVRDGTPLFGNITAKALYPGPRPIELGHSVPADLPPGKYTIHVTAEDIAHNVGTQEVSLEIW